MVSQLTWQHFSLLTNTMMVHLLIDWYHRFNFYKLSEELSCGGEIRLSLYGFEEEDLAPNARSHGEPSGRDRRNHPKMEVHLQWQAQVEQPHSSKVWLRRPLHEEKGIMFSGCTHRCSDSHSLQSLVKGKSLLGGQS